MSKPRRVLIISNSSVESRAGGGILAFRFARHLVRQGWDIRQLTMNTNLRSKSKETVDGVRITRTPYFSNRQVYKALSLPLVTVKTLSQVRTADEILIFAPVPSYGAVILAARLTGRRVVFCSVLFGADDAESLVGMAYFPWIRRRLLGLASNHYALQPEFTAAWRRVFGTADKVIETPQGIDSTIFKVAERSEAAALRRKLDLPEGRLILLTVGYIIPRKGIGGIIDALARLDHDFLYVAVGDYEVQTGSPVWSQRHAMEELVQRGRHLLGDRVLFLGSRDNVQEYMQASDVLIMNSDQEGLPNVLLEGMACGLAPVIRRMAGVDGYLTIHGENAEVFEDEEGLFPALDRVCGNAEYRYQLGANAASLIREEYSYDAVMKRIFPDA